ncbi:MAG: hypothetical protein EGQ96_01210 [Prevotella sp.]|nr:hypothetical protein [Prevotella sp.]
MHTTHFIGYKQVVLCKSPLLMARDRFLTNATDDLPETETKRHAPTIQDLYLLPNQGAEAVVSGSRDGRAWEQRRLRLGAETVAPEARHT